MKLLLTGSQGQVGSAIRAQVKQPDQLIALSHQDCDITNLSDITTQLTQHQPDVVINAAAYTDVDRAEQEKITAMVVNVDGAKQLAQVCHQLDIPLFHYSTDYVFSGVPDSVYTETDPTTPCNQYGHTKCLSEQVIQQCLTQYLILRVSGVFGLHGRNFINTILQLANTQSSLRVITDQYVGPTSANAIAQTTLSLIKQLQADPAWGIYHYTGIPFISWYTLAQHCITQAQRYTTLAIKQIVPVTTQEYAAIAPRPLHPQLDCSEINQQFAIEQPHWHAEVNQMIKAYYQ